MISFTKLFSSIVTSSIWNEDDKTRIVWITMLALADKRGRIWASVGGLAHSARISMDDAKAAIEKLSSPDDDSRTKTDEGRRIRQIDGGFEVINYSYYRELRDDDVRAEYMRNYMREYRKDVNTVNNVNSGKPQLAKAEAEAEAYAEKNTKSAGPAVASIPDQLQAIAGFISEWEAFKLHRRQKKAKMTTRAEELMLKKLNERPQSAILALQTAMVRGWQGFEWQWLENAPQTQQRAFQPEVRHDVIRPKTPPIKIN